MRPRGGRRLDPGNGPGDDGHRVDGRVVSMRWVLIHMLADTVRHAGHMDIVRELIDGAVGRYPGRE